MGEWPMLTVTELERDGILRVEDGNHGESRPRRNEFVGNGTVFVGAADMEDRAVRFAGASRINQTALERIRKGKGRPGDVLFSHKGTVGKLALVPPDAPEFVCSPQTTFWRSLDPRRLDRRFLFYFMQSPEFRRQWQVRKGETDMADYVSLTAQRTLRVALPSMAEQQALAEIFASLDEKIQSNQRVNRTLEEMAACLFKSWFVDFDPVLQRADGRRPFGLDEATTKLFPTTFIESDEGQILSGWTVRPLDGIAHFQNGLALQRHRPDPGAERLPVVKITQLRAGRPEGDEWASTGIDPSCKLADGDVVFSWSGTLIVRVWCGGVAALNQHLFKVTSDDYPKWFYLHWLLHHLPSFQAIASDKATTMGHIRRHHLSEASCTLPTSSVMEAADRLQSAWLELFIANQLESRSLAAVRDLLLPKLFNRHTTLKEVQRMVGAAL